MANDSAANFVSIESLDVDKCEKLFSRALEFKANFATEKNSYKQILAGELLINFFYEPSTRTRLSFAAAATNLGMNVLSTENAAEFSSACKGETLEDSVTVIDQYMASCVVLRHHVTGSVARVAPLISTPVINAGDGSGEHPTQALLDVLTVKENFPDISSGLSVIVGGDLAYGRASNSFTKLLSQWEGIHFKFISTAGLEMGTEVIEHIKKNNCTYESLVDEPLTLENADVVYWTRVQKERLAPGQDYARLKNAYTITPEVMQTLPDRGIVLHPLPRDGEITPEVDRDKRAKYFDEVANGLYVRMALLETLILQGHL